MIGGSLDVETVILGGDRRSESDAYIESARRRNVPLVIRAGGSHWPAVNKWSLDYVAQTCGSSEATCQLYGKTKPTLLRLPVDKAIERIKSGEHLYISEATLRFGKIAEEADLPMLAQDCIVPSHLEKKDFSLRVFMGRDTFASMHFHTGEPRKKVCYESFKIQIAGRKSVVLFSPDANLKAHSILWFNFSRIPFNEWFTDRTAIISRHPELAAARAYEVTLEPGDLLFIPSYWWHSIYGSGMSISATIFWADGEPEESAAELHRSANYKSCRRTRSVLRCYGWLYERVMRCKNGIAMLAQSSRRWVG